ncbi:MAG: serine protease, partial [Actinomycetota bacterium]|nr:serine protease [Actinomycetota bacterium]
MGVFEERRWLARVVSPGGLVLGGAFVVDNRRLLTCAHVVQDAGAAPGDQVRVDFPALGVGCSATVLTEGWARAEGTGGDTALLQAKALPDGVEPLPLRARRSVRGLEFAAYGFPEGYEDGIDVAGTLGRPVGGEWVKLEVGSVLAVQPGFSGGAVWAPDLQAAVGLIVTRDQPLAGRMAFMVPVGVIAERSAAVRSALPSPLQLDP